MTIVAKASAFPKSVQAGIPRLGRCPEGWTREPLVRHLVENLRPVKLSNDAEYDLVTVKRSRGGVVRREHLKGRDISVKSQFLLHEGDFLISKRQIVHGACGLVPAELAGSIVSNEYAILGAKPTIDLNFLNHLAHSAYFQQTCFHSSIGVHVEKMIFKLDRWLAWDFDLPPLKEQRRIAQILSTWDRTIETVNGLIASAREQKQALMHALLTGKYRLPGYSGTWKRLTFSDVAHVDQSSLGQDTPPNFSFRYISLSDVQVGVISQQLPVTSFKEAPSRARRRLKAGDLLMATVRPNLKAFAIVKEEHSDCIASTGFAVLSVKPGFDSGYLFQYLFSGHVTTQIEGLVVGSNYPAINSAYVKALAILCPDLPEQQAIAELLNNADNEINALESQLSSLREEKSALMQQLLTGRRRVKITEKEAV